MRALTHSVTALLAALWLSGCDGYAPPCDVAARHEDVANGAQGALIADADGGALLVDCLNPLAPSPVARVVKISIDGAVTSEHVIPLPDEPWAQPWAPGPGPTAGMPLPSCTWAGGGLGVITSNEEPVELRTGASGVRSTLVYRFVDTNGVAQPERTLEGSDCVDCQLSWTAVPHGDHIALLVSKAPLVQPGSIPAQELFVLDGGGEVRARHDLAWLATRVSLRGSQRANGLVLRSHRAVWLLDDELEVAAGPVPVSPNTHAALDWDLATDLATVAWVTSGHPNLLVARYGLDGTPRGETIRLSEGSAPLAVQGHDGLVSAVFVDDDRIYAAVADVGGRKLGGDVDLGAVSMGGGSALGIGASAQALLRGDGGEVTTLLAHVDRVDWLRVSCAP